MGNKASEANPIATLLTCIILGITPFLVFWNYLMSIEDRNIPIEYVMSVVAHEYIHMSYSRNDFDNYLG